MPGGKIIKDPVTESTGPFKIPRSKGEPKPPRERALMNRNLTPPGAIVVGEMMIRAGMLPFAHEEKGRVVCCFAHSGCSVSLETHPKQQQD